MAKGVNSPTRHTSAVHACIRSMAAYVYCSVIWSAISLATLQAAELESPEVELRRARSELSRIQNQLHAVHRLHSPNLFESHGREAAHSFAQGLELFRAGLCSAAVREMKGFQQLSQQINSESQLAAHYVMGKCYDRMGYPRRAVVSYLDYLSVFVGQPDLDYERLLMVLESLLVLADDDSLGSSPHIGKLLSSLSALTLPPDIRSRMLLMTAKVAVKAQLLDAAWVMASEAAALSDREEATVKANYLLALVALRKGEGQRGQELIRKTIATYGKDENLKKLSGKSGMNYVWLASARLHHSAGNIQAAIEDYQKVSEDSPLHQEALYELIFAYVDIKDYSSSYTAAEAYLARFPDDARNVNLEPALAMMRLRLNDIDGARLHVESLRTRLSEFMRWFDRHQAKLRQKPLDAIEEIAGQVRLIAPAPKIWRDFLVAIHDLRRQTHRMTMLRSELMDVTYTVGKLPFERVYPVWSRQIRQLTKLSRELLEIGHRLSAIEMFTYGERLNGTDEAILHSSANRRIHLFDAAAMTKRHAFDWQDFLTFYDLNRHTVAHYQKLGALRAQLGALRGASGTGRLTQRVQDSMKRVRRLAELLRRYRWQTFLVASPHVKLRRDFIAYADSLMRESEVLSTYREETVNAIDLIFSRDMQEVWTQWQGVAEGLFVQIQRQEDRMRKEIEETVDGVDHLERKSDQVLEQLRQTQQRLSDEAFARSRVLTRTLMAEVEDRATLLEKLLGDIDWMTAYATKSDGKMTTNKLKLEQQLMREELTDIEQGVLWQLPD